MDLSKEIRRAVDTGKVLFGFKSGEKSLLLGKAKAVILSNNAAKQSKEKIKLFTEKSGTPLIAFNGSGLDLGRVCGKPFNVSVLTILDEGKSNVLQAVKE